MQGIKVHFIVSSEDHNGVTEQLGNDLKEQMLASRKYVFVDDRKQANVWIEVIGVGEPGAAVSELLCVVKDGKTLPVYHTVSLVGLKRTNSLADKWLRVDDTQINKYLFGGND
jgi:hypothetical protein